MNAVRVGRSALGVFPFVEVLFQKRHAPPTAGSRAAAFADLAGHSRLMDTNVVHDLAFGDVKTQANFVVKFQGQRSY